MRAPASFRRPLQWLAITGLLAVTVAVYVPSLRGPFQFDDEKGVERNLRIRSLASYRPGEVFRRYLDGSRPVTEATFALNHEGAGLDPAAYHATNVGLHLGAALLAFLFVRLVLSRAGFADPTWPAIAAAGLFALHPIQTETVSYVWQRAELLASVAYLVSLLLLERALRTAGWRRLLTWTGAFAVFILGFGAKMVVVTVPAAFVLVGFLHPGHAEAESARPEGRGGLTSRLWLGVPFLVFAAVLSVVAIRSLKGRADVGFAVPGLPPPRYAESQVPVVADYLRLVVWPVGQSVDPDVPRVRSLLEARFLASAFVLILLVAGASAFLWRFRANVSPLGAVVRSAAFGILWFFLLLSPSSSVIPLADLEAEHRAYLASLGLFVAFAAGASGLLRGRGAVAAALAVVILATLAAAAAGRNALWASREGLWRDAVEKAPGKARPRANLGWALAREGRHAEAAAQYELAVTRPDDSVEMGDVLVGLGYSLYQTSRSGEAMALFQRAVGINPRHADAHNNLAICLYDEGRLDEAAASAATAIRIDPSHPGALCTLGEIELQRGNAAAAASLFERARTVQPGNPVNHFNLAVALEAAGDVPGACGAWLGYLGTETKPDGRAEAAAHRTRLGCGAR